MFQLYFGKKAKLDEIFANFDENFIKIRKFWNG